MKILGIIPARGGSKGIKNKNIIQLLGKPLLHYTINAALSSTCINKIFVSTDNTKIQTLAKKLGVEAPILRPKKFANDTSPTIDVIKHTLDYLEKTESYVPDIVITLQPTSPLRKYHIIDDSIHLLTKKTSAVIGVSKIRNHPYFSFMKNKKYLEPFNKDFEKFYQRQKFSDLFYPTGSIYTCWLNTIKQYDSLYGPKIKPLIINDIDIDIDNLFDLFMCEMTMKYWKQYNKKLIK